MGGEKEYRIAIPSGIGDFLWLWSKLISVEGTFHFFVPNSYPLRLPPFIKLVDNNSKVSLGNHTYRDIKHFELIKPYRTWEDVLKNYQNGDEVIFLSANTHLEKGLSLQDYLPDLETHYHFPFKMDASSAAKVKGLLEGLEDKFLLGIYTSGISRIKRWSGWMPEDWVEFIKLCYKENPDIVFVFIGSVYDIDAVEEIKGRLDKEIPYRDLVGKTSAGDVVELIWNLNYFVSFASGLSVIRAVLRREGCALFPKHLDRLRYSWVDPEMVEKKQYTAYFFDKPERIFYRIKRWLG